MEIEECYSKFVPNANYRCLTLEKLGIVAFLLNQHIILVRITNEMITNLA